jgi:hypothetical protein
MVGSPAVAEQQTVNTPTFYRTPDPTKLFANVEHRAKLPAKNFHDAFAKLASDVGISDDQFQINSEPLDNYFEIVFTGARSGATARCLQLFQSIALGKGNYKPTNCYDDQGTLHKFYVNPDKNGCQVRREVLCKDLKDIITPYIRDQKIFVQKSTGSIMVQRRVLASIVVTGTISARLQWMPAQRIKYKIIDEVQVAIEDAFSALTGGESRP